MTMCSNKDVGIFAARTLNWYEWHMNSTAVAIFVELSFNDAKTCKIR